MNRQDQWLAGMAAVGVVWSFSVQGQENIMGEGTVILAPQGQALPQLETIVVESATRTETPVSELTRSVTVVSEVEVEQQQRIDRSVGEILSKTIPGFSPSTEANTDFGQTLRGRTFLTLIDGVPQSTPLRDGRRSLNSIDSAAIERIEVIRGGTALYGFGATGGLVSIITKRPQAGEFNISGDAGVRFSTTHFDDSVGWNTNLQSSGRSGEVDYLISGTAVQRGGFFDADGDRIPADPVGVQGGLADTDTYNVLGKIGFEPDADQRFQLTGNYYSLTQDSDFAGVSFEGDPQQGIKTPALRGNFNPEDPATDNINLNFEYGNTDLWGSGLKAQLYYADIEFIYGKFPGFPQTRIESEKVGSRLTIDTPVELDNWAFEVVWGVDYLQDETQQTATDAPDTSPELSQDALAGFAQLELPIGEWGLINAGVRYEDISVEVSDFTNRQGVFVPGGTLEFQEDIYNLTGTFYATENIDLYGGFSQGFTVTEIGRSLTDQTFATAEEAESEAQRTDNYEIGLRAFYDRWDGSIVAFFSESDNGTTFDQNLNIVKQPEEIWGVELAVDMDATDRLRLGGTFTWMEGQVDLDNDGDFEEDLPSTRIPPTKITAYAEYAPNDWSLYRLQGLYSGDREVDSTQFGGTSDIDSYFLMDAYAGFQAGPGEVQVGVENLLNEDYFPVINQAYDLSFAFAKGPGRTVSLNYAFEF
ncbi:MAG: TonB-dependent receptor [Candidatus Competibacteraceae bacterium]|nr:TonB-dependent receptor [Candidatus Competibacteraceae bacterium]